MSDERFNQIMDAIPEVIDGVVEFAATLIRGPLYMSAFMIVGMVGLSIHILWALLSPFWELAENVVRSKN